MCFIALFKCIIINILINLMFVNFIFNIVFHNFTIQLKDFYLNKRFKQFLNANRNDFAIVTLFSI